MMQVNDRGYAIGPIELEDDKLADNHAPEELVNLIEDCLCPSYQSRPTAQQAVDRLVALQTQLSENKK